MTNNQQNKIRDILCRRDGMAPEEAQALIDQTIEEIEAAGYDPEETIEIMMSNLGLEGDYILDLFF